IEDEGNHGNDETRLFILSSLAAQHKSRVACVLCEEPMLVFDRYPLVDGTFFLSPKQHTKGCIEVKYENRVQYLTSVCMACLEGVEPNRVVRCRFCVKKWDGSSLVLGTMYSYDIFAAMPCCTERLKCNNCFKLMLSPHQRLNFYSDYSHSVSCPYCSAQDNHFATLESPKSSVNCGSLADANGRQEQQSPFNGSSASCSASTSALADKAAADSAAMSSFIQELRHLSNSSTISNISSTSNDSGFSTSYCGDSNVGSGRAAAINNLSNNNNMQMHQQPNPGLAVNAITSHQPQPGCKPTGTLPKHDSTTNPAMSSIIWGNKSLWGPAPPPSSPSTAAATSGLVSLSAATTAPPPLKPPSVLPSAVTTTNPTSNALYASLSKELYTPWTTSTANTVPSQVLPSLPPTSITSQPNNEHAILPKTNIPSLFSTDNLSTNVWESKLGLVSGPQQSLEPLESIWSAPEPAHAASMTGVGEGEQQQGAGVVPLGGPNAWRSDVPSVTRDPYVIGSQFLRTHESMVGRLAGTTSDAIDTTPKLSSLWTPGPWSPAVDNAANNGSNISVLRSLRMGGSACSAAVSSDAGGIIAKGSELNGGGSVEKTDTSTNSFMATTGSEEVMNYLNIFN
uniref:Headcase domain-containing protein n=1 Tax=Anopheles christyi TaxID=43041 RepID=A0A182KDT1_9DIPT